MEFFTAPGVSVDVNDNLNYNKSVRYKDSDVPGNGHDAENTNYGKRESSSYYTTLNIDKLRIGDEVVRSAFLGIQDPSSSIKKPGKWLASNMCSPSPRCHSASEYESIRKRSVSSTSVTPRRHNPSDECIKKEHVTSFQRSLKLLGVQPKDFGISNDVSTSKSHTLSRRVGPTFHTRLTNRSFSLENLKSVIQDHIGSGQRTFGEHLDRKMLSSAVYEEWYFQKLDEAHKRKKAEVLNNQRKKEDSEKVKREQRQKAEENFTKWKELKNKERQQWKQQQEKKNLEKKAGGGDRLTGGTRVKPNQEEAFLLWKREKDKLLKQKKLEQKIQETVKSDNEKKVAAEITYKLWKKKADQTMREKAQEEERRRQQEAESKQEKERLKRESAESSFCAWKKKKDSELRNKIKENKLAEEEKKNIQLMQEAERTYAAEQVFGEWLDQVDKRQNKQTDKFHKQDQRTQHQFPWWPGGSIHLYTK